MKNLAIVLNFILSITLFGQGIEYHVDKSKSNEVKFISDAPVESFEGVTEKIDGYLYYEGDNITNESLVYFEVDLSTIDTGIGLRNRHMRDNYLETDQFPMATYNGKIESAETDEDGKIEVSLSGEFFIHGNTMEQTLVGTITKTGNEIQISTKFIIKLSEYDIEVPELMFMKIDENMDLHVNFFMKKAI